MKINTSKKPLFLLIDATLFDTVESKVKYWNDNLILGNKKLRVDFLVFLIDLIIKKSLERKDKLSDGHVRLKAEYLKDVYHGYKYHIEFLIDIGLLSRIPYSIEKGQSYGYKIIFPSIQKKVKFLTYEFTSFTMRKKIMQLSSKRMENADRTTGHLTQWLSSEQICFDYEGALEYLENSEYTDSKFYFRRYCFEVLKHGLITYSREGKDNRLHSTLTNLPKDLRQFLRFKGSSEPLAEIDIRSSQPFHLAGIINLILKCDYKGLELVRDMIKVGRLRNKFSSCMAVMIPKAIGSVVKTELEQYVNLVANEDIYNYISRSFKASHLRAITKPHGYTDTFYCPIKKKRVKVHFKTLRDYSKRAMLEYMYCSLKSKEKRYIEIRRIMPNAVNCLIDLLKQVSKKTKDHKSDFPVILQNLEAGIWIDMVSKEIDAPKITIHDSVLINRAKTVIAYRSIANVYQSIFKLNPPL